MDKLHVWIGYDEREHEAYEVCRYSILKYSPDVIVQPIVQNELRDKGVYWREKDNASTAFSLTRFLVPYLMNYQDFAVFMDCDMMVTTDIYDLFRLADDKLAVQVVKHCHEPWSNIKMDAQQQTRYPRKNWSSVMLFNCGHRKNRNLTPGVINTVQPSFLHRLEWLDEGDIGDLPVEWNFLVDYYKKPDKVIPKNLHWTDGGPWFENYKNVDYSNFWNEMYREMKERD